jgi:hypothetical protein
MELHAKTTGVFNPTASHLLPTRKKKPGALLVSGLSIQSFCHGLKALINACLSLI